MATKTAETYDELRQRVLDGDTSVTPTQLEKARQQAEHDRLTAEAERLAAERQQAAVREEDIRTLRQDIEAHAGPALAELQQAYLDLITAAARLHEGITAWHAKRQTLVARGRSLDLWPAGLHGEPAAKAVGADLPNLIHAGVKAETYLTSALEEAVGRTPTIGQLSRSAS